MSYIKKLIILSGSVAKGTLSIERTAGGTFMSVSIYDLPLLNSGEYKLAVLGDNITYIPLGLGGKISTKVRLDDQDPDNLHCGVLNGDKVSLYGTSGSQRLTAYEFTERLRRNRVEEKTTANTEKDEGTKTADFSYSKRDKDIRNYFNDIEKNIYKDEQIAEVNYYPSNLYRVNDKIVQDVGDEEFVKAAGMEADKTNISEKTIVGKLDMEILRKLAGATIPAEPVSQSVLKRSVRIPDGSVDPTVERMKDNNRGTSSLYGGCGLYNTSVRPENRANCTSQSSDAATETGPRSIKNFSSSKLAEEAAVTYTPVANNMRGMQGGIHILSEGKRASNDRVKNADTPTLSKNADNGRTRKATFIEQIGSQLARIFKNNRHEEHLEKLLPESTWAVVDYDNKGLYYVIGNINDEIIGYGVPGKYTAVPPPELDGFCEWLPVNPTAPQGDGYWMMYQDARTGESIKN